MVRTFQPLMASLWKHTKLSMEIKTIDGKIRKAIGVYGSLTSVGAVITPPKFGIYFISNTNNQVQFINCRDSAVGIATRYGLDGAGIESRWGRDFPYLSKPTLRLTQPPIQWVQGAKRPGRGVDHLSPSSDYVKERVELYLYFTFGPWWPVLG